MIRDPAGVAKRSPHRGVAGLLGVLAGAALLLWPAVLNGYVLLNPDSMGYLGYGRVIVQAMLHPRTHLPFEARAEFYCLLVFLLRGGVNPWPVIVFQALLTSYVLYLVVLSIARRNPAATYVAVVVLLGLCTGLSWEVSWVMTDILGPVAYLCLYLLVFDWEGLSRLERVCVAAIAWWCIAAHLTHLLLSGAVLALLALLLVCRWRPMLGRGRQLGAAAGLLAFTAASLVGTHAYLYGQPSVDGYHPPYLMARVIADGPGRWYLRQHCPQAGWVMCTRVDTLPATSNDILWLPDSLWLQATPQQRSLIRQQEMPLVLASLRAYPVAELQRAMWNFTQQATHFGFHVFITSAWLENALDTVTPGSHAKYMRSLQSRNAMPVRLAGRVQLLLVCASCVWIAWLGWAAVRGGRMRVMGLALVALPIVVENALVCGVLSTIDDRLQNRVEWLVPLVAAMLLVDRWNVAADARDAAEDGGRVRFRV